MRKRTCLVLAACAVPVVCAITGAATWASEQPPAPAQPAATTADGAGMSIRGRVEGAAGWNLRKPDLGRTVIYLASDPVLDAVPSGIDHVTVVQKDKAFVPNFTVVPLGTVVEFPNWDNYDHNVFSRSKAAPAFDLDRYPKGQSKSRKFEKVGVVQVFCNIHPQMRAIVYVTPNRYFARSDAEGRFEIKGVPAGKYSIVAWHERCGDKQQDVEVGAGGVMDVLFTLEENRKSVMENSPPRREEGYGVERGLGIKREKLDLPVVKESHPAPK